MAASAKAAAERLLRGVDILGEMVMGCSNRVREADAGAEKGDSRQEKRESGECRTRRAGREEVCPLRVGASGGDCLISCVGDRQLVRNENSERKLRGN